MSPVCTLCMNLLCPARWRMSTYRCVCECVCVCQGARQKTGRMNGHGLVDTFWQFFWYSSTHCLLRPHDNVCCGHTASQRVWKAMGSFPQRSVSYGNLPTVGISQSETPEKFQGGSCIRMRWILPRYGKQTRALGEVPELPDRCRKLASHSFLRALGSSVVWLP